MRRFSLLSLLMTVMLAGCGQMIVFGHVMGDRSAGSSSKPESSSATKDGAASSSHTTAAPEPSASASSPPPATSRPVVHAVRAVSLVVTPEAQANVTGDADDFTADALLDAIKSELRARKLLDEQDPHATGTAEVVIDGLATRPTANAIVFGYKMLAGTLEGDIRVKNADGTESTGERIVAESRLTVATDGNDKNALRPLYRRFAVLAADSLAGVESKLPDSGGIPRF